MNPVSFRRSSFLIACLVVITRTPTHAQFVFEPPLNVSFDFSLWPTCIAPVDLNGDGFLDMVVTGRNVEGYAVQLMGLPGGAFGPPTIFEFSAQTDWVVARQLDGDADFDLAVAVRSGLGLTAYLPGTGSGSFGPRTDFDVGRQPSHMIADDFDADGDTDLVVVNAGSETLTVMHNNGAAGFTEAQTIHLGQLFRGIATAFYMTSGDFDGDKDLDVAVALGIGYVAVLKNQSNGTFDRPVNYSAGTPTGIAAGDLDDDGDVDLAYADLDFAGPGLGVLRNQGNGVFGPPLKFLGGQWVWYVALADLDRDGRMDVIISDALNGTLVLFKNQTQSQLLFSSPQVVQVGSFPRSVFPVDIDDDCDLDLLVARFGSASVSHTVQIFKNQTPQGQPCRGGQAFADAKATLLPAVSQGTAGPSVRSPSVSDLNQDGRINAQDLALFLCEWR